MTEVDSNEVDVKFMKKVGRFLYIWPQEGFCELRVKIVCEVAALELANMREQFKFSDTDRERIQGV